MDLTKVLPLADKQLRRKKTKRERSLTSKLFDEHLGASNAASLNMKNRKREASRKLQRRRTSQLKQVEQLQNTVDNFGQNKVDV